MGYILVWLLFGFATAYIASNRGANGVVWFIFGVLFGPFGFLAAFLNGKKCPGCAKKINAKAVICPYCRSSLRVEDVVPPATTVTKRGLLLFTVGVLVMFFACLGYIASQTNRALKGTATGKTALRSELADTPKTGVNKANFDRIRTGMTYAQVVAILGQSGEELSRSELAGIVTIMYSWKKPLSIGNMNAMFQNGKLVSKAQFGL